MCVWGVESEIAQGLAIVDLGCEHLKVTAPRLRITLYVGTV